MSDFEDGAWPGQDNDEDKTRVVRPQERGAAGTEVPGGPARSGSVADPYSASADSPYTAPTGSPYATPGAPESGYAATSGNDADKTVVDPNAAARVRSESGARPYADPYGDRDTAPRAYVASPPQQPPYGVEQDEGLGGGGVASRPVNSRRALKIFCLGLATGAALFIAFQVGSCVAGGNRTVADAGTNAVGSQGISGSKSSGANDSSSDGVSSSSDEASDADDSNDASDDSADSSDKDDAASKGADIGSSVGSAVGDAVGSAVDKLGSVDTSNITEKLGSAAGDIGDAAKDLLGQLTSN